MSYKSLSDDPGLYKKLHGYCEKLTGEFDEISPKRKKSLEELSDFLYRNVQGNEPAKITVICTHNSRRSHMGQVWLKTAAAYYGMNGIRTFSGGTESTAFNPRAVRALKKCGVKIRKINQGENPPYSARIGPDQPELIMYSKKYDALINPSEGFAAIMVCSEADAACPVVPGAEERFSIPYDDPKNADDTPKEEQAYAERCQQIAREMLFVMSLVKNRLS